MALEDLTGTKYLDDLVATNPAAGDDVSEGDDHIRGIKNVLKLTFPNIDAAVNATPTELNYVDGVTSAIQTQLGAKLPLAGGTMTGALTLSAGDVGIADNQAFRSGGEALLARYDPIIEIGSGDSGDYLKFKAGAAERMRINSSGNVGIGDTDPSDAKLSIDGVLAGDMGLKIVQAQAKEGLYIDQNGNHNALKIDSEANSNAIIVNGRYGLYIAQDISDGRAAHFGRNLDEVGALPLVTIDDGHASNTQTALFVKQNGAGYGLEIDQNGNNHAIYIDSESTSYNVIYVNADTLTAGAGLKVLTSSANLATTANYGFAHFGHTGNSGANVNNVVYIHNDHASSTGTTALKVVQDSTGLAAHIDAQTGIGLKIEQTLGSHGGNPAIHLATNAAYGDTYIRYNEAGESTSWALGTDDTENGFSLTYLAGNVAAPSTSASMFWAQTGKVGIGTTSPVADLDILGAAASHNGNLKFTEVAGDVSTTRISIMPYDTDNSTINFDAYLNDAESAWVSSDAGSNFQIKKASDKLSFNCDANIAVDSAITWNTAMTIENDGDVNIDSGVLRIGKSGINGTISSVHALFLDPPAGEPIVFRTAGTDIARFRAGGGLCFGTDTAAANALDDYEEGTFNAYVQDESGNSQTYYEQDGQYNRGQYTKIGNIVSFTINFYTSGAGSTTGSEGARVIGLPYTSSGSGSVGTTGFVTAPYMSGMASSVDCLLSGRIIDGQSYILLDKVDGNGNSSNMTIDEWSIARCTLAGWYRTG